MTKRKGKRSSRRESRGGNGRGSLPPTDAELASALQRAEKWIERGQPERAIELLEPLIASTPNDADLHSVLGYARTLTGDVWGAMSACEKAQALSGDPDLLALLASLYGQVGLYAHAWQAFTAVIEQGAPAPLTQHLDGAMAAVEEKLAHTARGIGRPPELVFEGLLDMERGRRLLNEHNYGASIEANRRAIEQLGEWPPPHNNLSQALFYDGQPREAMREVYSVLANHPENQHALVNGIRFLAWSGREAEARDLWARLDKIEPQGAEERLRKGEAAAILAEHESVYRVLRPLGEPEAEEELLPSTLRRAQFLLAVGEANTGHRSEAERRLRTLEDSVPLAGEMLTALKAGQSGTGWREHFRYFHYVDLLPRDEEVNALQDLVAQEGEMPPEEFRRRVTRFVERYPQMIQVAEKMIWEDMRPSEGCAMLDTIGTPEAYAALRRFALSQAGADQARIEALVLLIHAGEIREHEKVRAWLDGDWREVELRLSPAPGGLWRGPAYSPRVIEALNRGLEAHQRGDIQEAEALYARVLELDPKVKEAYNNLGAIYSSREEQERAKEMFLKAVETDPLYTLACGNLVGFYLQEEQIEEAERVLDPFTEAEWLDPEKATFLDFTRARILVERGEFDSAKRILKALIDARPDHVEAQELLDWIEDTEYWDEQWEWEQRWQHQRERFWREDLQAGLATLKPTLLEALPLYTKEALIGTARAVMLRRGWSTLRKGPLIDAIIEALSDRGNLLWLVEHMAKEERKALRTVLGHGGYMAWDDFDARYGNDLEESRYWNYDVPETTMGRLRLRGLLVEATVGGKLYIVVPMDVREVLQELEGWGV